MAIHCNTNFNADYLRRSANLPPIGSFTIMGWARVTSKSGAVQVAFSMSSALTGNTHYSLAFRGSADRWTLWNGSDEASGADTASVSTWYHVALVVEGTGAGQMKGYVNGALQVSLAGNGALTAGYLWVSTDSEGEDSIVDVAGVKVYNVALTLAEVQAEMYTLTPRRRTDLNGFYPMFPGSGERTRDYSGAGNAWTEYGTLIEAEPPPVSWGTAPYFLTLSGGATAVAVKRLMMMGVG